MKIYNPQRVYSASFTQTDGTIWYHVTKDQILDNTLWKDNIWIRERLEQYPLYEALDETSFEGSLIEDDEMYLMVSDYEDIEVNGESVFPVEAIEEFGLSDLEEYVSDETPLAVLRTFTYSDISWKNININEFAKDLLDSYSFNDIVQDAEEIELVSL